MWRAAMNRHQGGERFLAGYGSCRTEPGGSITGPCSGDRRRVRISTRSPWRVSRARRSFRPRDNAAMVFYGTGREPSTSDIEAGLGRVMDVERFRRRYQRVGHQAGRGGGDRTRGWPA